MVNDGEKKLFRTIFNFLERWRDNDITEETIREMSAICEDNDYDKHYAQRLLFATADYISCVQWRRKKEENHG